MRWLLPTLLLVAACDHPAAATPRVVAPPPALPLALPLAAPPPTTRPEVAPSAAGQRVRFATSTLRAGSTPGTPFRDPGVEANGTAVDVPGFEIDRLPYPNDPDLAPRTAVTRSEAAQLCAQEDGGDGRLCDELEWERACGDVYPGGEPFDVERCTLDESACATPDGVLGMGIAVAEWTASDGANGGVVRGASPIAEPGLHRCGARRTFAAETRSPQLGFRCCHGAAPTLTYPLPDRTRAAFEERAVDADAQRRILASLPEVARFADDFAPFSARAATHARGLNLQPQLDGGPGAPSDTHVYTVSGFAIAQSALVWAPTPGDEVWVFAGTTHGSTLIVAVYPLLGGTFRHAASFILSGETDPVAIGYRDDRRTELLWSSCWGCGGEGGTVTRKDDATIVITQR